MYFMNIGDRVKYIRKKNKLNQSQFASILGISQTHISKIESNKDIPSDKILRAISIEFSLNFDWLKSGEGEENVQSSSKEVLLKDSIRKAKLYLENCSDLEYMTFSSAILTLLRIWERITTQNGDQTAKLLTVSDMIETIDRGIEYLSQETKKIIESGIKQKIDEIFLVSDTYENKLSSDFDVLKNLYLGEGK